MKQSIIISTVVTITGSGIRLPSQFSHVCVPLGTTFLPMCLSVQLYKIEGKKKKNATFFLQWWWGLTVIVRREHWSSNVSCYLKASWCRRTFKHFVQKVKTKNSARNLIILQTNLLDQIIQRSAHMYILWITSFQAIKYIIFNYFIARRSMISFTYSETADESWNLPRCYHWWISSSIIEQINKGFQL